MRKASPREFRSPNRICEAMVDMVRTSRRGRGGRATGRFLVLTDKALICSLLRISRPHRSSKSPPASSEGDGFSTITLRFLITSHKKSFHDLYNQITSFLRLLPHVERSAAENGFKIMGSTAAERPSTTLIHSSSPTREDIDGKTVAQYRSTVSHTVKQLTLVCVANGIYVLIKIIL